VCFRFGKDTGARGTLANLGAAVGSAWAALLALLGIQAAALADTEQQADEEGVTLYRAVGDAEAADILETGTYRIAGASAEYGKYFYPTEEQAQRLVTSGWASKVTAACFLAPQSRPPRSCTQPLRGRRTSSRRYSFHMALYVSRSA